jgi:outer membrane protein OmpA-like peptidoglycan-associated protein
MEVKTSIVRFILAGFLASTLASCASSGISKSAANQVDSAYRNTTHAITHAGDNGLAAYPNTSGVVQGAGAGALTGALAIGFTSGTAGGALVGAAGGAIIGGVLGAYLNHNATTIEQLENHGAKVFVLGDQVMIVIPSGQLFRDVTPTIYPQAYTTLDLVAKMASSHTTMAIRVSAYTDGAGPDKVYRAVSQQQAEAVVRYLWPRVNTRVLSAAGYGNQHLVSQAGSASNSRIEIVFETLPV